MSAAFAFLHHLAAFVLFAAVVVEFIAVKDELTLASARRLQRADMVLGISAGVLLLAGFARVLYFEKGAAYYFHNGAFIAKLSLFVFVVLLSIYPTVKFLSWRGATRAGIVPSVAPGALRAIRMVIHLELAGVVLILLFAALMARGAGQLQ
jgi:putative membrane protein